ncbi:MAG: TlpA disulfide reductase family protein [Candidatus Omnitrophica bacterium]|jgi:peroxiredoxin|nr:TlpA disulfide reductase family protein [Candidatus Omnitrophota bacterium]MDD5690296.1 TlpA disulfide reductase family protein [Candidatus Omnitrophota bacterium]
MRKFIKGAAIFLMLTGVLVLSFSNIVLAGGIVLNDLESNPVNLSSLAGRPAILFFWTTWCPYCRTELRTLNKMYPQMEKEGLAVFAVNVGEAGYKVERFLKNYAINMRVLLDIKGQAAKNYEIGGVPTYIFLDKSGNVVLLEHRLPADYKSLLSE